MIQQKTILAILPARGGSKRVSRKNLRVVSGKPLIAWTIEEAKKSKYIDRIVLSSEDPEIIAVGEKWGCECPFIRPLELAQDDTPGIAPVLHLIQTLPQNFDYLVLLQPTSPLRDVGDIDGCIEKCISEKSVSCVSVSLVDKKIAWMFKLGKSNELISPFPKDIDCSPTYVLNGAVYVAQVDWLLKSGSFVGSSTVGFPMEREHSLDIDTELDLLVCELLLSKRFEKDAVS